MSKFCTTCGATLDDSATFCTNCGTPQQPSAAPVANAGAAPTPAANAAANVKNAFNNIKENVKPKDIIDSMTIDNIKNITKNPNKNTIIGLSVCGFGLILIILIICLLVGKPYKRALNKYFDAMEDCNGKKYMSVTLADFEKEYKEDNLSDKYDSLEEYYTEDLEETRDYLEDEKDLGSNIKYSYKIKKVKKIKDSKLKGAQKYWKNNYDLDSDEVKVTKGYEVKCKVTVKGKDDDDSDTVTYYVLKVNGDWIVKGWLPSADDDD